MELHDYYKFRDAYTKWCLLKKGGTDHILSPCHPNKIEAKNQYVIWKSIAEKNDEVWGLFEDDYQFRKIFGVSSERIYGPDD